MEYLKKCSMEYLNQKRREVWTRERKKVNHFVRESGLQVEWKYHRESTFIQGGPLYVTCAHKLLEKDVGPRGDLRVCFHSSNESRTISVHAQKKRLSESCSFMRNLLTGEMNDVQDDPEYEGMQMVELSQDLIQDCPAEWLKHLIMFLSWSRDGDCLFHSVNLSADAVPFDEILRVLKYCRMCHTLGIDVDVSAWTKFIQECVEQYNNQWIESALETGKIRTGDACISNVTRFDQEMFELWLNVWTSVLRESIPEFMDALYFFMLVNAAPATVEKRSTIASKCRDWFMSDESSMRYSDTLGNPFFVALLQVHTDFNLPSGVVSAPVANEEDFVKRKRRRTE